MKKLGHIDINLIGLKKAIAGSTCWDAFKISLFSCDWAKKLWLRCLGHPSSPGQLPTWSEGLSEISCEQKNWKKAEKLKFFFLPFDFSVVLIRTVKVRPYGVWDSFQIAFGARKVRDDNSSDFQDGFRFADTFNALFRLEWLYTLPLNICHAPGIMLKHAQAELSHILWRDTTQTGSIR